MTTTIIQFDLYYLLKELANEECELLGVKLIIADASYLMGISWRVSDDRYYRSFKNLSVHILKQLYLPKIISIRPEWQNRLNHWAYNPENIISLGKLV